jgi:putative thioredoxin
VIGCLPQSKTRQGNRRHRATQRQGFAMTDSPYIFEANEENFQQLVIDASMQVPVLVDFWADWCAPCRMLMPVLADLAEHYQGRFLLVKVNSDQNQSLSSALGVRSLPTVKLFYQGQVMDEFMGALPESEIRLFLDKNIPRPSDRIVQQGMEALALEQLEQAATCAEQAREMDPDNPRAILLAARVALLRGAYGEAQQWIEALPAAERLKPEATELSQQIQFALDTDDLPAAEVLEQRLQQDPKDPEALHQLSLSHAKRQDYPAALELLFRLLAADRNYRDGLARKEIVRMLDLLGGDSALAHQYRRRLATALY